MKNIVSFEAARKLEIAGLERPKIEAGQYWYVRNGGLRLVAGIRNGGFLVNGCFNGLWREIVFDATFDDWIYAPTATDILEQLPDRYILSKDGTEWFCGAECFWGDTFEGYNPRFTHENAAEAVAEAFLLQAKIK